MSTYYVPWASKYIPILPVCCEPGSSKGQSKATGCGTLQDVCDVPSRNGFQILGFQGPNTIIFMVFGPKNPNPHISLGFRMLKREWRSVKENRSYPRGLEVGDIGAKGGAGE